jgi:hypothetical protein
MAGTRRRYVAQQIGDFPERARSVRANGATAAFRCAPAIRLLSHLRSGGVHVSGSENRATVLITVFFMCLPLPS